ncbi:MAG TPA: hypothetical protein VKU00_02835 [Chthonomonadaceae bacterium]|nr:hypothetical protein [Chthonomonadaceae bacterium]
MTISRSDPGGARKSGGAGSARPAEFKRHNGALRLFVGDKPVLPLGVEIGADTPSAAMQACARSGIELFWLNDVSLGWQEPGKHDHHALEDRILQLLAQAGSAHFLLQVRMDAPAWWLEAHPSDCVSYCLPGEQEVMAVSWASRRWRNETGEALARLVRYVSGQSWSDRCLGYHLIAGPEGDWTYPHPERLPDVGPCMTEQFRASTVEKYRRNAGLLRRAWFDTRIDFDKISCPGVRERRSAEVGVLRSPHRSQRLLDYYGCLAEAQNVSALHLCRVVKKATEGRTLVGLTYAGIGKEGVFPEGGHLLPEPVLDSSDVDFIAAPGASEKLLPATLTGSLELRGKFLFLPHSAPKNAQQTASVAHTYRAGCILPADTTPSVLGMLRQAGERELRAPASANKRISQVAVVLDPAAGVYTTEPQLMASLLVRQLEELQRTGVPFDLYMLPDLFHSRFPDHKVTLFPNTFYLSEAERRKVDARVKRSEQTAVWLWAGGAIGEGGISAELGQRCCGQKLRLERDETSLRVRIAESNDPITWGYHMGQTVGVETALAPTITITEKAAVRLGANTANKTVFSVLRAKTWSSVVFGSAPMPAHLWRNICRAAGCHLYTDEGVILDADARSFAVHVPEGNVTKVSLPGSYDVTDAWTGQSIGKNVTEVTVPAGYYELRPLNSPSAAKRPRKG